MRKRDHVFRALGALAALQVLLPIAALAQDPTTPVLQEGEDRWVPSLAIIGGITVQEQKGNAFSLLAEDVGSLTPTSGFLRCPNPNDVPPCVIDDDDLAVSPFVGGSLEVMTPALPIPTRPRLFVSGEILPTFASDRDLALEGDPTCVSGPESGAKCATDEIPGDRNRPFAEDSINGLGTSTSAKVDTLVYGAKLGVSFPVRIGERQLRIKPSVGWLSYKLDAEGLVVDGICDPVDTCTNVYTVPPPPFLLVEPGFVRETVLMGSASRRFHAIGPGLDVEMDTGRYGPLGISLFLGGGAYAILGDRTISFGATQTFDDQLSEPWTDVAVGAFEVEVDPWIFRAHAGIRFQWLGSR